MAYNIAVIGTGYVGLVTGTCFAATGNNVYCVDIDEEKIKLLREGKSPIYEIGLERMIERNLREKRLHFTLDLKQAVLNSKLIFLCLPTPPTEDGSADLQHVLKVAEDIAEIAKENHDPNGKIVVNKSTVPVGTSEKVRNIFKEKAPKAKLEAVSNPEFLREGFAVEDAMKPERIIVGADNEQVVEIMRELYQPFVRSGNPIYIMDEKSAEITKYAANSFLAAKISFMNDLSAYCENVGADIEKIRLGIGSDSRIGKRFLFAGIGYGGSCFPKDVRALIHSTQEAGTPVEIVEAAHRVNSNQLTRFLGRINNRFNGDLKDRRIAIWGLSFKPNTDDTREAPAFRIIDWLLDKNADVKVYDQEAMDNTRKHFGSKIIYAEDMYDCLDAAEALIIATEWNVFRNPYFNKMKELLKNPLIFDGRNLFDPIEMAEEGFEYYCIGRKTIKPGNKK